MQKKERLSFIDISKGIAIILMVFAHSNGYIKNAAIINTFIYAFHMPLFFIVSGFLFNGEKKAAEVFKSKARAALLPYCFSGALFFLFNGFIFSEESIKSQFVYIGKSYLYGTGKDVDIGVLNVGPIWFLPCFFVANILFYFAYRVCKKCFNGNKAYFGLCCLLFAIVGIYSSTHSSIYLPWSIDLSMYSVLLMYVGYMLKNYGILTNNKTRLPLMIVSLIMLCYVSFTYNTISMNDRNFGNYICTFIGAVSGTVFVMLLSQCLEKLVVIPSVLNLFGQISIVVLVFHISENVIFRLNNIPFFNNFYINGYYLTLYRLVFVVIVYVIISITPLYYIFFRKRPRFIFINSIKEHTTSLRSRKNG